MEHIGIGIFSYDWNLKIYRYYIFGRKIIVWTDYLALMSLKTKRNKLIGRLERWVLKLQEYYINI
jgi:hypothetical protein